MPELASKWLVWPVFKSVRNIDISILIYVSVRYILAGTASIDIVLITLLQIPSLSPDPLIKHPTPIQHLWMKSPPNGQPTMMDHHPTPKIGCSGITNFSQNFKVKCNFSPLKY